MSTKIRYVVSADWPKLVDAFTGETVASEHFQLRDHTLLEIDPEEAVAVANLARTDSIPRKFSCGRQTDGNDIPVRNRTSRWTDITRDETVSGNWRISTSRREKLSDTHLRL